METWSHLYRRSLHRLRRRQRPPTLCVALPKWERKITKLLLHTLPTIESSWCPATPTAKAGLRRKNGQQPPTSLCSTRRVSTKEYSGMNYLLGFARAADSSRRFPQLPSGATASEETHSCRQSDHGAVDKVQRLGDYCLQPRRAALDGRGPTPARSLAQTTADRQGNDYVTRPASRQRTDRRAGMCRLLFATELPLQDAKAGMLHLQCATPHRKSPSKY